MFPNKIFSVIFYFMQTVRKILCTDFLKNRLKKPYFGPLLVVKFQYEIPSPKKWRMEGHRIFTLWVHKYLKTTLQTTFGDDS